MNPFSRPCLMLVTKPHADLPQIVAEAVAGGVDIVQWRDKTTPQTELMAQMEAMRAALHPHTILMVNGPLTLAEAVGHGLHLPETDALFSALRGAFSPQAHIGKSVHSVEAAQAAEADGADYLVAGTVYASPSHPDGAAQGLDFLRAVCHSVHIPVLAIGGVTPDRVPECMDAGAAGVAVLSGIMRASNPRAAARLYRAALDTARMAPQPPILREQE